MGSPGHLYSAEEMLMGSLTALFNNNKKLWLPSDEKVERAFNRSEPSAILRNNPRMPSGVNPYNRLTYELKYV